MVRDCRLGNRTSSLPEMDIMVFSLPLTGKRNKFFCVYGLRYFMFLKQNLRYLKQTKKYFCVYGLRYFVFSLSEQKYKYSLS